VKRRLALDELPLIDVVRNSVDDVHRFERWPPVVGLERHADPVECVVTGEEIVVERQRKPDLQVPGAGNCFVLA
jgi:hypothetical protein